MQQDLNEQELWDIPKEDLISCLMLSFNTTAKAQKQNDRMLRIAEDQMILLETQDLMITSLNEELENIKNTRKNLN